MRGGKTSLLPEHEQVEGTCSGIYGFMLAVLGLDDLGLGFIREGVGSAVFQVKYKCIAFKPHRGEVLDVVVTTVNKVHGDSPMLVMCV